MAIRVLVNCTVNEGVDPAFFEKTFEQISHTIYESNAGLIKDELIRSTDDPRTYIMISEWMSKEALENWRRSALHVEQMLPLRDKWTMHNVNIYKTAFINNPAVR